MIPVHTLSVIAIMFSHLFNTYEAVAPPPKSSKDFEEEIYLESEDDIGILDPLDLGPIFRIPHVEKPSDQPFAAKPSGDFMPEEVQDNLDYLTNNQLLNNIINTGRSFVGSKYLYGGTSPSTGFDCSGFISYIYKLNDIDIPRDTKGIFKTGKEVSLSNAQPGDIICSKGNGPSGRHVQLVSRVDPETNLIYVIEAKGRKYGIVEGPLTKKSSDIISVRRILSQNDKDPFLTNQDLLSPSPSTSMGKFNNKGDFIKALNAGYRRALSSKGLDPDYSYVLTAQAALESGWGKHVAGKYNFGGIKITDKEAREHPERAHRALTTDWSSDRGYFKHYLNFRNFSSIEDYCNYKIKLLSNKRYNAFNSVGVDNPYNFVFHILSKGYGSDYGGPESRKYVSIVMRNYNDVLNTLRT